MSHDKIEWNDALGDLQLLGQLEAYSIEAYISNDVENYYKFLRAYMQKLASIVDFDRDSFVTKFGEIRQLIWGQNDGVFPDQDDADSKLGKAMEDLEALYLELTTIKVKAGLSVDQKKLKDEEQKRSKREKQKEFPIFDFN